MILLATCASKTASLRSSLIRESATFPRIPFCGRSDHCSLFVITLSPNLHVGVETLLDRATPEWLREYNSISCSTRAVLESYGSCLFPPFSRTKAATWMWGTNGSAMFARTDAAVELPSRRISPRSVTPACCTLCAVRKRAVYDEIASSFFFTFFLSSSLLFFCFHPSRERRRCCSGFNAFLNFNRVVSFSSLNIYSGLLPPRRLLTRIGIPQRGLLAPLESLVAVVNRVCRSS